ARPRDRHRRRAAPSDGLHRQAHRRRAPCAALRAPARRHASRAGDRPVRQHHHDPHAEEPAPMKLYVCWGTFTTTPRPGGHPCGKAYEALKEAGYEPEVIRSYGFTLLPDFMNRTAGRQEAKRLTGKVTVPVLLTDEGEVVSDSKE